MGRFDLQIAPTELKPSGAFCSTIERGHYLDLHEGQGARLLSQTDGASQGSVIGPSLNKFEHASKG